MSAAIVRTYGNYPRATISWPASTSYSSVIIQYYDNTGSSDIQKSSGPQTGNSWTTDDLSFGAVYTFTLTTYNRIGIIGGSRQFTVTTTPPINGYYDKNGGTTTSTQIQWGDIGSYSYVKLYRKIILPYSSPVIEASAGANFASNTTYYDVDISGNTTYLYYVQPYDSLNNGYSMSNTISLKTNAQSVRDISLSYYDSSAVSVSFTLPKNSYAVSYYYLLQLNASGGIVSSASGSNGSITVTGLSGNTTYSYTVGVYLDGVLSATSASSSISTFVQSVGGLSAAFYDSSAIQVAFTLPRNSYTSSYYYQLNTTAGGVTTSVSGQSAQLLVGELSGNTEYSYNVDVYLDGALRTTTQGGTTVITAAQAAANLSAAFYDSSAIQVTFTLPRNSYTSSYYYQLSTTYQGVTTSASGQNTPLLVDGLSGNTTYSYNIAVYLDGALRTTTQSATTVLTSAQAAANLSTAFYDSSAIQVAFTLPRNSYTSTYYYQLSTTYQGITTSATGQTAPLLLDGLSGNTTYDYNVGVYLDGTLRKTTQGTASVTTDAQSAANLSTAFYDSSAIQVAFTLPRNSYTSTYYYEASTTYQGVTTSTTGQTAPLLLEGLSGNTTYDYNVGVYLDGALRKTTQGAASVTTDAQAASNLSTAFYDSSAIQVAFTLPRNSYTSTYYYQLSTTYQGITTSATGQTAPLLLEGLSGNTTYDYNVGVYLDGTLRKTTQGVASVTTDTQAAANLSTAFYDSSAIQVAFTLPRNSYTSTYYYQLSTTYQGITTSATGQTAPLLLEGLSGNTTYNYNVGVYLDGTLRKTTQGTASVTTDAQSAANLSTTFYDSSAIQVAFTLPRNSYTSTYYYQLSTTYQGITTSATGQTAPLLLEGLSGNTTYDYNVGVYLDGALRKTTQGAASVTTDAQAAANLSTAFYDSSAIQVAFTLPRNSYTSSYYYQLSTTYQGVTTSATGQTAPLLLEGLSGNTTYDYNVGVYLDGTLRKTTQGAASVTTDAQAASNLSTAFYDSSAIQVAFTLPRNSYTSSYYYQLSTTYQGITTSATGQTAPLLLDGLSGNTTYDYNVGVYLDGTLRKTTQGTASVTTDAQSAANLSTAFYDSSAIQVAFTLPRNSYTSTYYYEASTTYQGVTTSTTGQTAPLLLEGLSGNTTYDYNVGVYLDGALRKTTQGAASVTTDAQAASNLSTAFYDSSAIQVAFTLPRNSYTSTYYYEASTTYQGVTTSATGQTAPLLLEGLSGNTTYNYNVGVYLDGTLRKTTQGVASVTTDAQAAANLSTAFYDSSAIQVAFTLPRNSYTSSYYYQLSTTYQGVTTSASGQNTPLLVGGLSGNTTYSYNIAVYLDGALRTTTQSATTVLTSAQAVANLSTAFYDSSAIQVAFTLPRNSYTSTYYYQLSTTYQGITTSATGQTAPLLLEGLSGNTTYNYNVGVYLDGTLRTTTQGTASVTTDAQAAANLSTAFYDSSAIQVAFTLPRNSYTSSYYYEASTTYQGITTSATGQTAPLLLEGLSGNTTYDYNVGVYLDGTLRKTTQGAASVTTDAQSAANLSTAFYDSSAIQVAFTLPRNSYTSTYYYEASTTYQGVTTSTTGQTAPLLLEGLSGNTTYDYNVGVYLDGALRKTTQGAASVTTDAQAASNLSTAFYDSSAIQVAFTLPRNSYTSTYYYEASTTYQGVTTSATGQTAPLLLEGLSGNTTYNYNVGVYLDGALRKTTQGAASVTTDAQAAANLSTAFYDSSAIQVAFTLPRNSYTSSYYYEASTTYQGITTSATGQTAPLLLEGLSGNTTYDYNVGVYLDGTLRKTTQGAASVTTDAQAAANLTTAFYDSSAIQVAFTLPRNSYTSSYYYEASTTYQGITTSATGQTAPLLLEGLSGNTTYNYNVGVYLDGAFRKTTQGAASVTTDAQAAANLSTAFYDSSAIQVAFTLPRNSYTSTYYYQLSTTYQGITTSATGQTAPLLLDGLSGNTTYDYNVGVYLDGTLRTTTQGTASVTTDAQAAANLSTAFYDSSAIQVAFTLPRNSYTSSYYYEASTTYQGITTSATGQTAPLLLEGLSGNTTYDYNVGVYLDGTLRKTTQGAASVTTDAQAAANLSTAFYDSSAIQVAFTLPRNSYTSSYYYEASTTYQGVTTSATGQTAPLLLEGLSGNTTYNYNVGVYLDGTLRKTTQGAASVTTDAQAAANLSTAFYDSSAIQVAFTLPRNSYTSSYYYEASTTYQGVTTSATGQTAPLLLEGLSGNTTYNYNVGVYLDGALRKTTQGAASVTTDAQAAANLSTAFYDSSAIQVAFTLPRNSYTSTYYYQLSTTYEGITTSTTGQTAPLLLEGLSGNTTYNYNVGVYLDGTLRTTTQGTASVTTDAQAAANLSTAFYDSSAIQVAFTLPRNSYTSSYYYEASTTYQGITTSATGQTAPLLLEGLSGNTTYDYNVGVYLDGTLRKTTQGAASVTTDAQAAANLSTAFYDSSAIQVAFTLPRNSYTSTYYYQLSTTYQGITTSATGQTAPILLAGLSGNTTYDYNVGVYLDGTLRTTTQGAASVTTDAQAAANLSTAFYDSSAIQVAFTLPRNSYTSSYYYQLSTTYQGITTSTTGQTAPLLLEGLSGNTTYDYSVGVYLDGALRTTTQGTASVTTDAQAAANLSTAFYDSSAIQVAFTLPRNSYTSSYYYEASTTYQGVTTSATGQTAPLLLEGLSGNTTYDYNVGVYLDGTLRKTTQGAASVTTDAQAAANLSIAFYDSSAIQVAFTLPRNSYTSTYYYQLSTTYQGITTSASGQTAPLLLEGLSGNTTYDYNVGVYLDGTLRKTTQGAASVTTDAQAAANLSTAFYDSSAIQVAFTLPRNSYTSSYYYEASTTYQGITTSTTGQTAPLLLEGLSGNTTYDYNVGVYLDGTLRKTTQGTASVTTDAQSAANLSTTFYDSSAIQVAFTLPRNSYTSTYYYQLSTTYQGITISATGQTAPILLAGLSGNTTYNYNVGVYLDGALRTTTQGTTSVTTDVQAATNLSTAFYDSSAIQVAFTLPRNSYTSSYYYQLSTTYQGITTSATGQSAPLLLSELSGNTTYSYAVGVYLDGTLRKTTTSSVTTYAQSVTDLNILYYDSSGIQVSFTLPRNSYTSSYYYKLNTNYSGVIRSVTGQSTPLFIKNLSGNTMYTYNIDVYLDGTLKATSNNQTIKTYAKSVRLNNYSQQYAVNGLLITCYLPINTYSYSYYNILRVQYNDDIRDVIINDKPIFNSVGTQISNNQVVSDLCGNLTYNVQFLTYLDGIMEATSPIYSMYLPIFAMITDYSNPSGNIDNIIYDSSSLTIPFVTKKNAYLNSLYYQILCDNIYFYTNNPTVTSISQPSIVKSKLYTIPSNTTSSMTIYDLSGNTTYYYVAAIIADTSNIKFGLNGSITTPYQSVTILDYQLVYYINFITLKANFKLARNKYTTSYYYKLNVTESGTTTSITGQNTPLEITTLRGNTTYTYNIQTYTDGTLRKTTYAPSSITTNVIPAGEIVTASYNSSGFSVSFVSGSNKFTTRYFQVNATYAGIITSASGTSDPITVTGLSGNTTYTYNIATYLDGILRATSTQTLSVTTDVQSATNLTTTYYDSSGFNVSFTLPRNGYTTSYYYQVDTSYQGITSSVTGQTTPLLLSGLSGNTTYSYAVGVYLDGALRTTTQGAASVTTDAQAASNLSTAFYDSSAIQVAFTLPRNSYTSSYYYEASTTYQSITTSASGQSAPILLTGLSGNTTYSYNIGVYLDGTLRKTTQGTASVTTDAQAAANLSTAFYDSSAIQVAFTLPRNSYTSTYYYQLSTTYQGITTSATGQTAPILLAGLSGNTTYSYNVAVYLDGTLRKTTQGTASVTTDAQAASNLSTAFYDSSAIQVAFTLPRNSYISSYYYQASTTYQGITTSATGQTAPILLAGLSGNTTYSYNVAVYLDGTLRKTTQGAASVTTDAQAASNLSTAFYDSSAIQVAFTLPRNSYTSSYYYQLNTTYAGITTSATGQTAPILLAGLSGNTTYSYNIGVYLDGTLRKTTQGTASVTTDAQAAANLSTAFYDSSAIQVAFTLPRNSYTSTYYYQLSTTYQGITTSATGQTAPILLAGLSGNTTYSYNVAVYLDGTLRKTTQGTASVTTDAQAASNLSTAFYDSSAIQVAFTLPRNSYTSSYYYQASTTYQGITTSATGQTAPILLAGLSGNTTYSYNIGVYLDGTLRKTTQGTASVTTDAQAASNLSTAFYDSSAIQVAFTLPRNSYTSTYYYQLSTTYQGITTSATGQTAPILLAGLSGNTTYSYNVAVYLDGTLRKTTQGTASVTTLAQVATNLAVIFYDSSAVQVSFTLPRNSYTTSYYYQLNTTVNGIITTATGQTSPIIVTGLSGNALYTCSISTYLDGSLASTSNTTSVTTYTQPPTNITNSLTDSSSIQFTFTPSKNNYTTSYYYQLNAVNNGTTTSTTSQTNVLWVTGLTQGTTYTCNILTYLDGVLKNTSDSYTVTTSINAGFSKFTGLTVAAVRFG